MAFADGVQHFVAPQRGRAALKRVLDVLATIQPTLVEPDYPGAFRYLAARNRKRALTVLFSDVIDRFASDALVANVASLRPRHLPLAVTLKNPELEQVATLRPAVAHDAFRKAAAEELLRAREEALTHMRRAGGRIVGIRSGSTIITAAALNFDAGQRAAADTVRVSAPIEVDSIRPKTVRYGELLTVYGIGVDSIFLASLDSASLIPNPVEDTTYAQGTQRRRYWVPFPARTDSLVIIGIYNGNGGFGFVHGDTTKVMERDIFEPDDTIPHPIDLDAAPPFAALPTLLFFNPALAFERLKRGEKTGVDWYHFTQAQPRDLTIVLTAPQIAGTFSTFLTDSMGWKRAAKTYVIGSDAWTFGPGSHACHGAGFAPAEAVGDSTIVAFKNAPAGALDAIAIYSAAGRYGLGVIAGYQSELPADAHEDDNSCNAADLRGTLPAPTFRDTLTIENPHDVDWIRFHYTNPGATSTAQVRLHAFPGV